MSDARNRDVIIVGAGLSGLSCGVKLAQRGIDFEILEASDRIGGRVRTDIVDGFRLDHGFQVLLTAYPAAQQLLDYDRLGLQAFEPGALVRSGSHFKSLDDPWRRPVSLLSTAMSGVGTLADKIRIGLLRQQVCKGEIEALFDRVEQPTEYRLRGLNFSEDFIEQFLRPWMGGVLLDRQLETSSRIFEFVFRMFSLGDVVVPAEGMQAIPQALMSMLPQDSVRFQTTVSEIDGSTVGMSDGMRKFAKQIVVATEGTAAARLLRMPDNAAWREVSCLYFAADEAPLNTKKLVLSGEDGPINNMCEISSVASSYAPQGRSLISVSVLKTSLDPLGLEAPVRRQLKTWFGSQVDAWSLLKTFHIPFALPGQSAGVMQPVIKSVDRSGLPIVCGDHRETASIQGAMSSGMRAAEAVCGRLGL